MQQKLQKQEFGNQQKLINKKLKKEENSPSINVDYPF